MFNLTTVEAEKRSSYPTSAKSIFEWVGWKNIGYVMKWTMTGYDKEASCNRSGTSHY